MSSELSPQAVLVPSTNGPALGDQATGWAFQRLTAAVRANRITIPAVVVFLVLIMLISGDDVSWIPLIVVAVVCVPLMGVAWWRVERRVGRYVPRIRRMLADQAWRSVPARLVQSGERPLPVIELGDGSAIRLRLLGAPLGTQHVLARVGRVWMVGPEGGVAVLRVDGLTGLVLGHVLTALHEESPAGPLLPRVPYTGSAADDVVASWVASRAMRVTRRGLIVRNVVRVSAFLLVLVAITVLTGRSGIGFAIAFGVLFLLICVVLTLNEHRRAKNLLQLSALLLAGPWHLAQARFEPWTPGRGAAGIAPARGELDGVEVTIPQASINLMTYALETGTLWVAGRPERGRAAAVGIAGYPVLAVARFPG